MGVSEVAASRARLTLFQACEREMLFRAGGQTRGSYARTGHTHLRRMWRADGTRGTVGRVALREHTFRVRVWKAPHALRPVRTGSRPGRGGYVGRVVCSLTLRRRYAARLWDRQTRFKPTVIAPAWIAGAPCRPEERVLRRPHPLEQDARRPRPVHALRGHTRSPRPTRQNTLPSLTVVCC